MYRFYEQLAGLLALKAQWFLQAPAARCQSPQAAQMAAPGPRLCPAMRELPSRLGQAVGSGEQTFRL